MDTAVEVWEGEGGAPVATEGARNTGPLRKFWIGMLCGVAVVVVLARGKAVSRPRKEEPEAA